MILRLSNEWRTVKLKDVCHEITVGHVGPMKDQYIDEGIPFLRSQNVRPFKFASSGLCYISPQFHAKLKKSALAPGDVVVTRTGANTGQCCVIPKKLRVANCADLVIFRPSASIDSQFLMYLLNSEWGRATIAGGVVGAAQHHFNIGIAKEVLVRIPNISAQRKIASILSAYDDLIENNSRRIAILESMAQAIYREWFVIFRFPGHENVKLVQSPLGMIPEGWAATVGDYGKVITGKTPTKTRPENFGGEIPFVKTPDMHRNLFCISTSENLSEVGMNSQSSQTIPANSVCISCIGTVGAITITTTRCQTNQQINSIIPHSPNWREFIVLCLQNAVSRLKQIGGAGATMDNISKGKLMTFEVLLPPREILAHFSAHTSDLFDRIRLLQKQSAILRTTRDLLLPKLISGQLNVEDLDIDVGMTAEEIDEPTAKLVDRKPFVPATAEIDGAPTASTTSTSDVIPAEELDVDQVMAEFRQQARRLGTTTRGELLKAVSQELGYKRLGKNIEEVLKGHLRAAIRRKIIAANGENVCLHTPSMEAYDRDELIDAFQSVMRKNFSYEREDVIRALANHLGFRRLTDTVREPIKSAINAAIRRGVLEYKGELIWRGD